MDSSRDSLVLAAITALTLIGAVVTNVVTGSVPEYLSVAFTTLVGATAGVSVGKRANGDAADDASLG